MPKKKKCGSAWECTKSIFKGIWAVLVQIFIWIKYILILIERSAKTIAIFIVTIAFLVLSLATSFYLFSSTFGIKDSPVFQELRDKMATIYVLNIEKDLEELEAEVMENNETE